MGYYNLLQDFKYNSKYILSILNSKLIDFWYRTVFDALHLQGGGLGYELPYFLDIPFKEINSSIEETFINIVDKIIKQKANDKDTTELEREIDTMVYELYGLNNDEIDIVEGR